MADTTKLCMRIVRNVRILTPLPPGLVVFFSHGLDGSNGSSFIGSPPGLVPAWSQTEGCSRNTLVKTSSKPRLNLDKVAQRFQTIHQVLVFHNVNVRLRFRSPPFDAFKCASHYILLYQSYALTKSNSLRLINNG